MLFPLDRINLELTGEEAEFLLDLLNRTKEDIEAGNDGQLDLYGDDYLLYTVWTRLNGLVVVGISDKEMIK